MQQGSYLSLCLWRHRQRFQPFSDSECFDISQVSAAPFGLDVPFEIALIPGCCAVGDFGGEVVASLVEWGDATLGKGSFTYPVAVQNTASRRIAEKLRGEIIGNRANPKYDSVVYGIPFCESTYSP